MSMEVMRNCVFRDHMTNAPHGARNSYTLYEICSIGPLHTALKNPEAGHTQRNLFQKNVLKTRVFQQVSPNSHGSRHVASNLSMHAAAS